MCSINSFACAVVQTSNEIWSLLLLQMSFLLKNGLFGQFATTNAIFTMTTLTFVIVVVNPMRMYEISNEMLKF